MITFFNELISIAISVNWSFLTAFKNINASSTNYIYDGFSYWFIFNFLIIAFVRNSSKNKATFEFDLTGVITLFDFLIYFAKYIKKY